MGRPGAVTYRGIDIGDRLREAVLDAGLVDIPKNGYFETCLQRLLAATGAREMIVPLFELAEGRAILRAARRSNVRTIAVQHGSLGLPHRWRFSVATGFLAGNGRDGAALSPHAVAVEGRPAARWLCEDGFSDRQVAVVGAPRLAARLPDYDPNEVTAHVLVLGDLHFWPVLFDWCLRELAGHGLPLVLRPHPAVDGAVRRWFQNGAGTEHGGVALSEAGGGFDAQLTATRPLALVVSATGAGLDAALAGWPVGIRRSNWLPDGNPLSAIGEGAVFASPDGGRFREWLGRLRRDGDFRRDCGRACRDAATELVAHTGPRAASQLIRLVDRARDPVRGNSSDNAPGAC